MKKLRLQVAYIAITIMALMPMTSCSSGATGQDAGDARQTAGADSLMTQFMCAVDSLHAAYMPECANPYSIITMVGDDSIKADYNELVGILSANRDKYISDDSVNSELLYDDVVAYFKEKGNDMSILENSAFESCIRTVTDKLLGILAQYKDEKPSLDEFTDQLVGLAMMFYDEYSEQELKDMIIFSANERMFCPQLNKSVLRKYAGDMTALIGRSDMPDDMKEFCMASFQLVVDPLLGR